MKTVVIHSTTTFLPIPIEFIPTTKVQIIKASDDSTTDVTARVMLGKFKRPTLSVGEIGSFKIQLSNTGGVYTNEFTDGDTVRFYADLKDGSTKKFEGRVDHPKDDIGKKGQFLNIDGRHASYLLTETFVSKTYIDKTIDYMLKDIIDTTPSLSGYTYNNVATFTNTYSRSWSNAPLTKIIEDLCELEGADGYVDNGLDIHLFAENSIANETDAFADGVPGRYLFFIRDYGEDGYYKKDRITVIGKDNEGMDIMYTAGSGSRQARPIVNASLTTMDEVRDFAEAKLAQLTTVPPQAIAQGYGLPTLEPGENFWIFSPRNQLTKQLKAIEITDIIGFKSKAKWIAEVRIEKEKKTASYHIKALSAKETDLIKVINPNNLEASYNFTFDDESNIAQHSGTEVSDGSLVVVSGQTSGTMTSSSKTAANDITQVELRYKGENLENTTFEVSVNDGTNFEFITKDELLNVGFTGKDLIIRVNLNGASAKVYSLAVYFK